MRETTGSGPVTPISRPRPGGSDLRCRGRRRCRRGRGGPGRMPAGRRQDFERSVGEPGLRRCRRLGRAASNRTCRTRWAQRGRSGGSGRQSAARRGAESPPGERGMVRGQVARTGSAPEARLCSAMEIATKFYGDRDILGRRLPGREPRRQPRRRGGRDAAGDRRGMGAAHRADPGRVDGAASRGGRGSEADPETAGRAGAGVGRGDGAYAERGNCTRCGGLHASFGNPSRNAETRKPLLSSGFLVCSHVPSVQHAARATTTFRISGQRRASG